MNCDLVTTLIPLYYYGELAPDDEDQLDQHLHECAACAAEMERHRKFAVALDKRRVEIPASLLDECREDLLAAIAGGAPRQVAQVQAAAPVKGPWKLFLEALSSSFGGFGRGWQPAAAVALMLLAFFGGRYSTAKISVPNKENVFANVRNVSTAPDGSVRIVVDETQRQEISGRLEDANIQQLIEKGAHDEDAAVRVESVGLMKNRANLPQVLDSLLNALENDPNDGVRLKALDALKPMAGDARVTKALSKVLLADTNPALRQGAIDLIVARRDDDTVRMLQNVMEREDNNAVRLKASKILKDWNASPASF